MKPFPSIGIQIPEIYLPEPDIDLNKWAVIACDQFTSQPEYWQKVADLVGDSPSTLHLVLPEVYLGTAEETNRIHSTQQAMRDYLVKGVVKPHEGLIYVERTVEGKTRRGLMLALDLEKYDFSKGSQSLIRATEGTILDRLPPRMRIREGASLELPHIIVLVDDPEDTLLCPLESHKGEFPRAYDFDLMLGSGHLSGWFVNDPGLQEGVIAALEQLSQPELFQEKYQVGADKGVLLFAVGDGNHSLATAKSIWEKLKPAVGMDHPARYALVEIENVHDKGLEFEPIHRVLFNVKSDPLTALKDFYPGQVTSTPVPDQQQMIAMVRQAAPGEHRFGMITNKDFTVISVAHPVTNLAVGTLQAFLDPWMKAGNADQMDYVHGDDTVCELGSRPLNVGFYFAGILKNDLFKTVILDGVLPRKTFSMGEAHEKRFYMECRRITPEGE
ncbi:MAG TPA: DUF1015 domain-containing protein [Anaerolineaceae bacterium]|nr:DUF1015 domain-containing protein [Anaerolineaceae bacterium]